MDHAGIVEQQRAEWLVEREAQALRTGRLEHACLAALDARARHQDHRDEIHAVAMRALGREPPDAAGGSDAKRWASTYQLCSPCKRLAHAAKPRSSRCHAWSAVHAAGIGSK